MSPQISIIGPNREPKDCQRPLEAWCTASHKAERPVKEIGDAWA